MRALQSSLVRMVLFLIVMLVLVGWLLPVLRSAFLHNIPMNTLIFGVILIGCGGCLIRQVQLLRENRWLRNLQNDSSLSLEKDIKPVTLLHPLQNFLKESNGAFNPLQAQFLFTTLDGRLDETRELSRYVIRILIFLGLLGTFWGLSQTVTSISQVISKMNLLDQDSQGAFQALKNGLQSPLHGMGIAFSSSLFGLVGSLVVGFLDRENQSGIRTLITSIEDFLQKLMLRSISSQSFVKGSGPAYTQGLLEMTAHHLDQLVSTLQKSDENRMTLVRSLQQFSDQLAQTLDLFQQNQVIVRKLAQSHIELHEIVKSNQHQNLQESFHKFSKSFDLMMLRVLEELIEGRRRSSDEIRGEIRLVSQTLSALANGDEVSV